jgi:putative phage-type endonuclease
MNRDQFLERRKQGLGGSDIAAIIGLSPWRTPRDIYLDKKGLADPEPETDAMYWGTTLEDIVAREYSKRTGRKIERCNVLFRHPEHSFLIGNLDRVVYDDNGKKPVVSGRLITRRILECKTVSQYAAGDWGEPGTDQIPEYYKAQVQWYMGLTGAEVCDVAVLIGGRDFRIYTVYRDDEVIAYLFAEGVKFWREYIEGDTMPPARTLEDVENVFSGTPKARAFASIEITEKVGRYKELDDQIKALKAEQDPLKVAICDAIGDAVELVAPDARKLASWSAAKPTSKTDWKAVAEELEAPADVIAKHTTETMSARRFTITAK